MSLKKVVIQQYRENVNRAKQKVEGLRVPSEGWLRTTRKALGMSGAQLGRRLGVTRGSISNTEKAELNGGVTLKAMQQMAEGLGCRFVYAVVPEKNIEDVIYRRALKKAREQIEEASVHMALEEQVLSSSMLDIEVRRLADEMFNEASAELWNDDE
ncbi:mobile mystery protein A [Alkalimarinus alittae]|uniref:Mobile mystery protein A n=1 Tax=Alkalimarinus alittae TaxID=2961619 RepID=A0ABY6N562_9ALTE|nr:mobile mystery protein A [Alkalimarinus alittae]UZE97229.1 mobile mystery protein A [Alkalimarinus alittae]